MENDQVEIMNPADVEIVEKHPGGRPAYYSNPDEMQKIIDKYFEDCKGEVLTDKETGEPILDKHGNLIIWNNHPPTVTGLAIALGFTSRQALINYQNKDQYFDTISRAKMLCQEYAEKRLYDKEGSTGAKFSLQNNYGWKEKSEVETTIKIQDRLEDYFK